MADLKISQLTATTSISDSDLLTSVQGGVNKKFTGLTLKEIIGWERIGTTLSPKVSGDDVNIGTGDLTATDITSLGDILPRNNVRFGGTASVKGFYGPNDSGVGGFNWHSSATAYKGATVFLRSAGDADPLWQGNFAMQFGDNTAIAPANAKGRVRYMSNGSQTEMMWWTSAGTIVKSGNLDLQAAGLLDDDVLTPVYLGDASNTSFDTTNKTIIGSVNEVKDSVPIGQRQNVTINSDGQTAFTVGFTPISNASFSAYRNGVRAVESVHYTLIGTAFTWLDFGGITLKTTDTLIFIGNQASGTVAQVTESNYLTAYDDTTQTIVTPSVPQDITFSQNVILNGWTHTPGSSNFTCAKTGIYIASMSFICEKTVGATQTLEFEPYFNGVAITHAHTSVDLSLNNILREVTIPSFIFSATAGQILKVMMEATATTCRLNQHTLPEPTAKITIWRIA